MLETTYYRIHEFLNLETTLDLPIPESFAVAGDGFVPDLSIVQDQMERGERTRKKRSGAFFYWTEGRSLTIEYELPIIDARLVIEDLEGKTRVRFTEAFLKHGDITKLAETLVSLKLIQTGHPLVHTAALSGDDGAVLFTALRDTGKTSTVLSLLDGDKFRFMSDDQVLLDERGTVHSFPRQLNISPFTLTGNLIERSSDPTMKVKRWLATSRFEILFGDLLSIEMGERQQVPEEYIDHKRPLDRVIVLSAGDPDVREVEPDQVARKMLVNTLELFNPFGIYSLNFYFHAFDFDIFELADRQRRIVNEALDGVTCHEVTAWDVEQYPELVNNELI